MTAQIIQFEARARVYPAPPADPLAAIKQSYSRRVLFEQDCAHADEMARAMIAVGYHPSYTQLARSWRAYRRARLLQQGPDRIRGLRLLTLIEIRKIRIVEGKAGF